MKSGSVYLLGFATGVIVLMFLPALVMAGIRLAGYCPYSHEKHILISQWVQIVWMAGAVQLMWLAMLGKRREKVRVTV